jgi:hypothetical protein
VISSVKEELVEIQPEDLAEGFNRVIAFLEEHQGDGDVASVFLLHAGELGVSDEALTEFGTRLEGCTGSRADARVASVGLLVGVFAHRAALERSRAAELA